MAHGITKVLVESVVHSLNDKAERLGWTRRYEVQFGSSANGVKHVLQTRVPHLSHAVDQHPFNTLSKVHQYLQAMGQVLNDALLERSRQRAEAVGRGITILTGQPVVYDPDARALRPGE
jgi:hypothetical protein